jgi:hypothetical protein
VKSFIPKLVVVIGVIGFLYGFYSSTYYNANLINIQKNKDDNEETKESTNETKDSNNETTKIDVNTNTKCVNFNGVYEVETFETKIENNENEN